MKRLAAAFLGCLLGVVVGVSTGWAEETGGAQADRWSFTIAPYVYMSGLKGNVGTLPPAPSGKVDASFNDIVKNLDLGFMGAGELRKGRFGILADVFWTRVTGDFTTPRGLLFSGGMLESDTVMATVAGAFRIAQVEHGWLDMGGWLDVVGGVRGYYVGTDLTLNAGLLPQQNISNSTGWVDGLGGLRGRINIWKGLFANAITAAGGGGSNVVVDLMGGMGYAFSENISAYAGYRYIKVDYQKNTGFIWDVEYKGPVFGMAFTF
ncbi:MAG: hypothetical protein OEV77_06015 [Nitrospira sp.]|nr:hypothetical protein [Nitrospira sp.]